MTHTEQPNGQSLERHIDHLQTALLPRLATANDVRELVQYLKRRPGGVNLHDLPQPIKKRIFSPTKIASYEFWGLVDVNHDRIKLTPLGSDFARSLEPEAKAYRDLLKHSLFYRAALEWIQRECIDVVTQNELASYWQKEFAWAFISCSDSDVASAAVTFFHLCQAAEVGAMTNGKRGQPTRLRVWRDALREKRSTDYIAQPSP